MLRRLVSLCLIAAAAQKHMPAAPVDVVYGGTASGVITAYSALVKVFTSFCSNPARTSGGMVTVGLFARTSGKKLPYPQFQN